MKRQLWSLFTLGLGAVVAVAARDVCAALLWTVLALAVIADGGRK